MLGDLILDRYTWGNAERISQEAPVIVLRADRREARLGGAANVANMLAALEATVTCCGVVGDDAAGERAAAMLLGGAASIASWSCDDAHRPDLGQRAIRRPGQQPASEPDPARRSRKLRSAVRGAGSAIDRTARRRRFRGTTRC